MNHAEARYQMELVIRRLACTWIVNHSIQYAPMVGDADPKKPKWDKLLKRPVVPYKYDPGQKPVIHDPFLPSLAGGPQSYWLLMGQVIGPCYSAEKEADSLEEYWQLWAEGLAAAELYRSLTGGWHPHTPWLWTLEAPPPHLL